jgi:plasmid stability protein
MPSITIKNVPEGLLERLRQRAKEHRRSLQAEVLTVLEHAAPAERRLTVQELYEEMKATGLRTPATSAELIRQDRDRR